MNPNASQNAAPTIVTDGLVYAEIQGLTVDREMGALPQERGKVQRITMDALIGIDPARIAIPDSAGGLVSKGFDLAQVREAMKDEATRGRNLLETLGNAIADRILELPGAKTARVAVRKDRTWADTATIQMTVSKSKS